jgi:DNA-binding response OmpR family regulator
VPSLPITSVLVVEDEWVIADQITGALEEAGYDVVGPVGRLREALALLNTTLIHAALIDINIHGDRSFGLAAELSRLAIPFAFLSGYSGSDLPATFSQNPLLQKPVEISKLRSCVEGLLQSQM